MTCPECNGKGGGSDYWGEWDDCQCCKGRGLATTKRVREWREEIAEMDREVDRAVADEELRRKG